MQTRTFVQGLCCSALACMLSAQAQSSGSTTLVVNVPPECVVGVISQSPGNQGSPGGSTTQTLTFIYKLRTAASGVQGQISLRLVSAGAEKYPEDSRVDYQTQINGPGTSSSGSTATSEAVNAGIVIARFGPLVSSTRDGATGTVQYRINPSLSSPLQTLQPSLSISCR